MPFTAGEMVTVSGSQNEGSRLCQIEAAETVGTRTFSELSDRAPGGASSGRIVDAILCEQGVATVLMLSYSNGEEAGTRGRFAALVYRDGTITDLRHQKLFFSRAMAA